MYSCLDNCPIFSVSSIHPRSKYTCLREQEFLSQRKFLLQNRPSCATDILPAVTGAKCLRGRSVGRTFPAKSTEEPYGTKICATPWSSLKKAKSPHSILTPPEEQRNTQTRLCKRCAFGAHHIGRTEPLYPKTN